MGFFKKLFLFLVLLVGGVYFYGRSLPREHRASAAVTLVAPQDTVFAVVRHVGSSHLWWSDAKAVRRLDRPKESWELNMGAQGMVALEVSRVSPPTELVTTIINDDQQTFGGSWIYQVRQTGAGTEVVVTEEGWVDPPLFRVVQKLIGHHRTINSYLSSLGAHFGESVTPRRLD
jgi:uncharacterized protein YndB with AHSA1/START domain